MPRFAASKKPWVSAMVRPLVFDHVQRGPYTGEPPAVAPIATVLESPAPNETEIGSAAIAVSALAATAVIATVAVASGASARIAPSPATRTKPVSPDES